MLRLNPEQRGLLAEKICDTGNLIVAGLLVGQFVTDRPFSTILGFVGIIGWFVSIAGAVFLSSRGSTT